MNRSFLFKAASVATLSFGAIAASSSMALAQNPTDELNFTGSARVANAAGNADQLFIDFLTNNVVSPGTAGTITATQTINGAFAAGGLMAGASGTVADLTFSTAGTVNTPNPFVTLGGYTFSLTSTPLAGGPTPPNFGPVLLTPVGTSTSAAFAVNGVVTAGPNSVGRAYTGIFTAQFANQTPMQVFNTINTGGALPVSFSANFALTPASVVPEPSTYALLATGIGALGLVARRRRSA